MYVVVDGNVDSLDLIENKIQQIERKLIDFMNKITVCILRLHIVKLELGLGLGLW